VGCNFRASAKALNLHFIQNHQEGRFRIVLETPEDIKKWREERRRNWPTPENIEAKKRKLEQDREDGIAVKTKEFVYRDRMAEREMKRQCRGRGRGARNGGRGVYQTNSSSSRIQSNEPRVKKAKENEELEKKIEGNMEEERMELQSAPSDAKEIAASNSESYSKPLLNQDEVVEKSASIGGEQLAESTRKKVMYTGAGNAMLRNITAESNIDHVQYPISEREDGELNTDDEKEEGGEVTPEEGKNNKERVNAEKEEFEDCASVSPLFKENKKLEDLAGAETCDSQSQETMDNRSRRNRRGGKGKKRGEDHEKITSKSRRRVSLLEMLLANEIRHERNVILQCIRYITKNNFLQT